MEIIVDSHPLFEDAPRLNKGNMFQVQPRIIWSTISGRHGALSRQLPGFPPLLGHSNVEITVTHSVVGSIARGIAHALLQI